ncbi:MAG: carbamoyl-phosphate synthase (glutamine-hydrolyzing) large subunit [Candidatus Bathyarchaeota archaeon]
MPKFSDINKVLIIGSGAIKIGEAGEFDYSGAQAIKAVKEEQIEVVLVNPNVATIQTDKKFVGEKAYFLPLTVGSVEQVIKDERPDGVLLGFGGQTALNLGTELHERGIFKKHGVNVLGTSLEAIERADDRDLFRKTMARAGIPIPESRKANTVEEALRVAEEIGYPIMMRVAYTLGGQGTGVAYSQEDLMRMAPLGLAHSRIRQVLIEQYLGGWKEIEYEVLRDHADNCMIVCSMENFDPMGVHTGDSIVVAPSQTVSDELYQKLKENSFNVLRALGLVGECNIQYAVHPDTEEFKVIEVNSRLSRSSALASKATGYPIAYVTAKIALGYNLDEIRNPETGEPVGDKEPLVDYTVVKMPRWDFQKFKKVDRTLGTQMKSVGEVMAIGKTFEEAIQKAVRMLDQDRELTDCKLTHEHLDTINNHLMAPTDQRLFAIVEAIRRGFTLDEIHELTKITPVFIEGIKRIVDLEFILKSEALTPGLLMHAKMLGFSDAKIAKYRNETEQRVRESRLDAGIYPKVLQIKTAKRWASDANYLYFTYNSEESDPVSLGTEPVLVLGSGCYRIGSSVEFDWCCVNMSWSLKEKGVKEVIMLNCNPETVSTDFDVMDKLYFEELTLERVLDIVDLEKPRGVVVSVGGQTPNRLAMTLARNGVKLLGSGAEIIDKAEDRAKFSAILDELGIKQPQWSELKSVAQAKEFASTIGYPVIVRPSYVLSGSAMSLAYNEDQLVAYLRQAADMSSEYPVTISKFVNEAKELEVDGVCDGENVYLGPVIEHIEDAGVHSGDATMVIPTLMVSESVQEKVKETSKRIARALGIKGPFNIQYLAKDGNVYVIECNLRASRSMPFVSKIADVNLMEYAAQTALGEPIEEGEAKPLKHGIKSPLFSFMQLQKAEPLTGVEMVSTGEVACFGSNFREAFLNSLVASGVKLPKTGDTILVTVGGDKVKAVEIARKAHAKGFKVVATKNTGKVLKMSGVPCSIVAKVSEQVSPNILTMLENKHIQFVINTPNMDNPDTQTLSDGYLIRRKAVEFEVPLLTNLELAAILIDML